MIFPPSIAVSVYFEEKMPLKIKSKGQICKTWKFSSEPGPTSVTCCTWDVWSRAQNLLLIREADPITFSDNWGKGHKWLLFAKNKMFVNQCGGILFLYHQIHLNLKFRQLDIDVIFRFKMQTWMYMINNICTGKECSNVTTEIGQL